MKSWPMVLAVLVAIVWGLCFVLIKASSPNPAPLLLAATRSLAGGAVLILAAAAMARWRSRGGEPTMTTKRRWGLPSWRWLLVLSLTNSTLALGAMYLAANQTEASVASILAGGQPVALAAAGWLLFHETASRWTIAGLVLAMAGVVLVATGGPAAGGLDGVGLALLAAAAPTVGTIVMRRLTPGLDVLATTGAQFLLGGLILLGFAALLESWGTLDWSTVLVPDILVLGFLGTGVAYGVWFWLLPRVPLVRLGAVLFVVPATGVLVAILLGERPSPIQIAGSLALLGGIGLVGIAPQGDGRTPETVAATR